MYKRIVILAITGLLLVLGTNYLLVYAVQQQAMRARARQDKVYWRAFNEIEHFGEHPDATAEQQGKAALDEVRKAGLGKNRESVLQNYFQDLQRCYQGEREYCGKVDSAMNAAIVGSR
jgi:hypothetical protein